MMDVGSKEVIFGGIDGFTRDKPSFAKILNHSFVVNLVAGGCMLGIFYLL